MSTHTPDRKAEHDALQPKQRSLTRPVLAVLLLLGAASTGAQLYEGARGIRLASDFDDARLEELEKIIAQLGDELAAVHTTHGAPEKAAHVTQQVDGVHAASQAHAQKSAEQDQATALEQYSTAGLTLLLTAGGVISLVRRRVQGPLKGLTAAAERLGAGDTMTPIEGTGRRDEIDALAAALERARRGQVAADAEHTEHQEAQATAEVQRRKDLLTAGGRISQQVDASVAALTASFQVMTRSMAQTLKGSESIRTDAERSLHDADTVSSSSEQVAASTEELSVTSKNIAQQATVAEGAASGNAETMRTLNGRMQALSERAARIGTIANGIGALANQTNLLALNATIEAARAGEAGKGFAVVAAEVKALANQTTRLTEQVTTELGSILEEIQRLAQSLQTAEGAAQEARTAAASVAASISEQDIAIRDIAKQTANTASAIAALQASLGEIAQNAQAVQQDASAATARTQEAATGVTAFQHEVNTAIRAATAA